MIIAISSPPPVDTKELASNLASTHGLRIIEDPAPSICKEFGFQTLYDMPEGLQGEIRERLIREHVDFIKANDDVLLNFSVFGYLADWMRWFWSNTPTEKWEEIVSVAREATNRYDKIHHIEDGKPREYDGYVWFDKRNAAQLSALTRGLYGEFNVSDKIMR